MFTPSIFGEILKLLPRSEIAEVVRTHDADRYRKSFRTWDHLVAMLGAQFGGVTSLRELEILFGRNPTAHYHLHCHGVRRSTLADANANRDEAVFAAIAQMMIARSGGRRKRKQAQTLLSAMDSTPIRLAGRGHGWAAASRTRLHGQGLKLHVCLSPEEGGIDYAALTDINVNDIVQGRRVSLRAGHIYLFDKGYYDFNWWNEIIGAGAHFVTRLKRNAAFKVTGERPVKQGSGSNLKADKTIVLTNAKPRGGKTNRLANKPLRLVEIEHPAGKDTPFLIVSDMLDEEAETIADYYKNRWRIEILFKWIKQNLNIKRFIGENRNAVAIQIYCALIAYILIIMYRRLTGTSRADRLVDIVTLLRTGLFQPARPPDKPPPKQIEGQYDLWRAAG